jgi:hypothetical protein
VVYVCGECVQTVGAIPPLPSLILQPLMIESSPKKQEHEYMAYVQCEFCRVWTRSNYPHCCEVYEELVERIIFGEMAQLDDELALVLKN